MNNSEYLLLFIYASLGLVLLISANDLLSLFLTLELQGLSLYVISAFKKDSIHSISSGLKYFILGAFSSSLFLFGSSFIYGLTGLTNFFSFNLFFFEKHLLVDLSIQIKSYCALKNDVFINSCWIWILSLIFVSLWEQWLIHEILEAYAQAVIESETEKNEDSPATLNPSEDETGKDSATLNTSKNEEDKIGKKDLYLLLFFIYVCYLFKDIF